MTESPQVPEWFSLLTSGKTPVVRLAPQDDLEPSFRFDFAASEIVGPQGAELRKWFDDRGSAVRVSIYYMPSSHTYCISVYDSMGYGQLSSRHPLEDFQEFHTVFMRLLCEVQEAWKASNHLVKNTME